MSNYAMKKHAVFQVAHGRVGTMQWQKLMYSMTDTDTEEKRIGSKSLPVKQYDISGQLVS
jgi:hypothetical protein